MLIKELFTEFELQEGSGNVVGEGRQGGLQGAGPSLNRMISGNKNFSFLEAPGLWSCRNSRKEATRITLQQGRGS